MNSKPSLSSSGASADGPRVGLFVTCLVDLYRPSVGFAAIDLLEQCGCQVIVPEMQTCCGQPAYNSGDKANAITLAKQTIEAFSDVDYVVAPSGSCAGMLKHHYPELFAENAQWRDKVNAFAERVYELTSFLTEVMQHTQQAVEFNEILTYHDSCAGLRELDIKEQPRQLLNQIKGISIAEMDDTEVCCGFGGTFCVKFPEISERMVSDKVALAQQSGASVLTGGDLGCLLNISGRMKRLDSPMRVYHVAEILANMSNVPGIGEPDPQD